VLDVKRFPVIRLTGSCVPDWRAMAFEKPVIRAG
jgi:hypothetical protein